MTSDKVKIIRLTNLLGEIQDLSGRVKSTITTGRHKYLRDDHYLNGYDHHEDDDFLYITYKGHTIGTFSAHAPIRDNEVFKECADKYQAALELADLGKRGIEFVGVES